MAFYLQMDGVDDYVKTPSVTFNRVEMEFSAEQHTKATQFYFNARDGAPLTYLERQVNGTDYGSLLSGFRLNGVNKQNSTAYIPFDERVLLTFNCNNVSTARVNFFSSQSGVNCMKGNLYMIKLYHNNTLVAHYDMSLGNVQDQSGNGNHATLNGGIWVQDTPTEPIPTTINFHTAQVIYKPSHVQIKTKQIISKSTNSDFRTKQIITKPSAQTSKLIQHIFKPFIIHNKTTQTIFKPSMFNVNLMQNILKHSLLQINTKQEIYIESFSDFKTEQAIFVMDKKYIDFATKQIVYKASSSTYKTKLQIIKKNELKTLLKTAIYKHSNVSFPMLIVYFDSDSNYHKEIIFNAAITRNIDLTFDIKQKFEFNVYVCRESKMDFVL